MAFSSARSGFCISFPFDLSVYSRTKVYWFCGEEVFIRQIEGEKHAYHFLEDYKTRVLAEIAAHMSGLCMGTSLGMSSGI